MDRVDDSNLSQRSKTLLIRAQAYMDEGKLSQAYEQYISFFDSLQHLAECPAAIKFVFATLSEKLIEIFSEMHQQKETVSIYLNSMLYLPDNYRIINEFGKYLFARGDYLSALHIFGTAAAANYLPAEKNLLHTNWCIIPRWHFRMLNDQKRNAAYHEAIINATKFGGCRQVVDIGSGCGLLSLFAASQPDVKVVAFEENHILAEISKYIFEANNVDVNIKIKNSNNFRNDLKKFDLIVTEIFDVALFGEKALTTIAHALDVFVKENFRIIPAKACLYVTGMNSKRFLQKHRYIGTIPELNMEELCLIAEKTEPYDAHYFDWEQDCLMTETQTVFRIDFHDRNKIDEIINCTNFEPISLKCREDGEINTLIVWFDLQLDDKIKITTNPLTESVFCWEQAIFYLDHPIHLKRNDNLIIKPHLTNDKLDFEIIEPTSSCESCMEVSKELISFLNDNKLIEAIVESADFYSDIGKSVLDLNIFPLMAYLMAKKGYQTFHVYRDKNNLEFLKYIMEINHIKTANLMLLNEDDCVDYLMSLKSLDIIYPTILHIDGSWDYCNLSNTLRTHLKSTMIPRKIFLHATMIYSQYLDICNVVSDENLFNFKVAKFMNDYTGTEHPLLENFPKIHLTEPIRIDISDLDETDFEGIITANKNGDCNGILYWFEFQFTNCPDQIYSTLNSNYYNRTCSIMAKKSIISGNFYRIYVKRVNNYMKVYCDG